MGKEEVFDYYYGTEAEQFSFFRIPRVLIQDPRFKQVSTDAKLLYGLMLDRMSLSMKNGWLDEENRVYIIYTLENIMEDLSRTPPGKTADDKYFLGFFQKDQTLIAILDLIFDYPKPQVAYIGLFMLDVSEQGKGTGSNIMKGVFKQLANQGITCVRLGCIHGNVEAASFWKRNGFYSLKEQLQAVDDQVDLMEKVL